MDQNSVAQWLSGSVDRKITDNVAENQRMLLLVRRAHNLLSAVTTERGAR